MPACGTTTPRRNALSAVETYKEKLPTKRRPLGRRPIPHHYIGGGFILQACVRAALSWTLSLFLAS